MSGSGDPFTLVVLPDTQFYSESYPATFTAQTQWIVNQRAARNIVFVTHLGDIVNVATTESQWVNADTAMSLLDGQVPYGMGPGNHDLTDSPMGTHFNAHFPVSRYDGQSWYGGHYGSDNLNSWQTFDRLGDAVPDAAPGQQRHHQRPDDRGDELGGERDRRPSWATG